MAGTAVVYLHGFPGGPGELALFGAPPPWAARALVPDRAADRTDLSAAAYFDDLAGRADRHAGGGALHLVGFSLGARVALELAARLGARVARVDLVSPAGPLDGSDHLNHMAGKAVFGMAMSRPRLFGVQTAIQGLIARNRPGILYRALFGAGGEAGMDAPGFPGRVTDLLRACFVQGNAGYTREVLAYVAPWSGLPARVTAPVTLWQGSADGWTPPRMAERLMTLLPDAQIRRAEGKGHYGTLHDALARLTV